MTKQYKQPEEAKEENMVLNPISYLSDMIGKIETITTVPTGKPINMINQIKFYSNGSTYRLYIFDSKNSVWRYTSLT